MQRWSVFTAMSPGSLNVAMPRLLLAVLLACFLGCFLAPASGAENVEAAQPSTLVSDVHVFVVAEDGSLTEDDETTLKANTPSGIGDIAQRYIWFDKSTSTVEIQDAYSISADGVKHVVAPDQIREIQE